MRLPYIPDDPVMSDPSDQQIVDRVKQRRGGKLLQLDKALLHAPPVADGWNSFLRSIRTQTTLPDSIRELAICRVAALNGAWYEWDHHVTLLRESGGLGEALVEKLKREGWKGEGLDERHRVVLEYTDAMTRGVVVRDELFGRLKGEFGEREVTVAAYNCVSRFLVALDVGEMAERDGVDVR